MDADEAAARRTAPSFVLCDDERVEAVITDVLQVRKHAHAVPGSVPPVQLPQSPAWISLAVVAEARLARPEVLAVRDGASASR